MKKMTASEIRSSWINFFESKNHFFIPPANLIPVNDPSLLWINSGVATLKNYFSGKENPPSKRLVNSQKALRTNDFFNVGVTARHHTLFEMLGNFSIGDYFKKEAIEFAYELLTQVWEIDVNKLWITIYEDDVETYSYWTNLGIKSTRIIKCGRDRNFWDVGNGPCGPCTEIHYDRGEKYDPQNQGEQLILNDIENDRYIEIWNIVFSQFNNDGQNNYTELLRKNIDTGAGLERLACISQDVPTNFDTDLFQTIIHEIEKYSAKKYCINAYFKNDINQIKINFAYKVIADHFRAAVLAICDGAIPDNKDRGYVLRRLLRRAIVFAHNLNISDPKWVSSTVNGVVKSLGDFYTTLINNQDKITKIINKEVELFSLTLKQGMKLFLNAVEANTLDDDVVFNLVTTYGFPIDLIKEMANEKGLEINESEFEKRFAIHQKVSNARNNTKAMDNQNEALLNLDVPSKFNYDAFELDAKVIKLYDEDFGELKTLNGDGYVVFDETVFYATSGGQIHDTGTINNTIIVDDVIKAPNFQHVHHVKNAHLNLNDIVHLKINIDERHKNMAHHSTEHLLQAALQNVVTNQINQQGAFKSPYKLSFDFQYHEKLSDKKIQELEDWVNDVVKQAIPVEVLMMTLDEAKASGAIAIFEDKYKKIGGLLRVIKMGDKSCELCGGTHVTNTKDIEQFAITNYISNGSGRWRIEGLSTLDNINRYKVEFLTQFNEAYNEAKNNFLNNSLSITELDNLYHDYLSKFNNSKLRHYINLYNDFNSKVAELKNNLINEISKISIEKIKTIYGQIIGNKKLVLFGNEFSTNDISKAMNELIKINKDCVFCALVNQNNKLNYYVVTNKQSGLDVSTPIHTINEISGGKGFDKSNFCAGGAGDINTIPQVVTALLASGFKNA